MFESDKRSALDRLKKSLYSRKDSFGQEPPRHDIHGIAQDEVRTAWEGEGETVGASVGQAIISPQPMRKGYKLLLKVSFAFLIIAIGIAAFTFFGGGNSVSVDNVDILIDGPVSVGGGVPLSLNVSVTNKNNTEIQLADLIVEYPAGSKDPTDPSKDLSRLRFSLGNIAPGAIIQRQLDSLMFGQEGEVREVKFTVEYRTADSNAIFYKEKPYKLTLASSPLLVSFEALDKVLSNQPTDVKVTVASNSSTPVKDLLLVLEYPFGFSVVSSDTKAAYADNVWRIGDLDPAQKKTITLRALVKGEDGEERTIHANVGIRDAADDRSIATTIISGDHTFALERPFLGLDLSLDGQRTDSLAVEQGKNVRADIAWTNNSASRITNARIEVRLTGSAFERNSVNAQGGFYNASAGTIVWEAGRTDGLDSIAPGETGRLSFSFNVIRSAAGQGLVNASAAISVTATGSRVDESGVSQTVSTGATSAIKLISNLSLSARALRTQGPISNTGPIPPKADQETTYTVVWTVTNTSNTISGAQVTATIPQYMRWTGTVSPSDAQITYNPVGGQITWMAGGIPQNAGVGAGAKQVAFQLALKPTQSQIGSSPDIMGESTIVGLDAFTGATIRNSASNLSTRTTTDLLWKPGDETVGQ